MQGGDDMPRRYLSRRVELELEAQLARERQRSEDTPNNREVVEQPQERGLNAWRGLVEQRILDGMSKGMFDNLRGMGQPLNLDDDAFVPQELKMAFRMLRSTGLSPLWIEVNKEIREDIARLQRFRVLAYNRRDSINEIQWQHLRQQYEERIVEINSKILSYNIMAPSAQVHIMPLIIADELSKFDDPPESSEL
jgi:DnaJ family protein C protein 28